MGLFDETNFSANEEKAKISLQNLLYYFDSQERDRLDRGMLGRRNGQVLAIREKLLSLPESQFDAAIKTIEKLVADPKPTDETARHIQNRRAAIELFEKTNQSKTIAPDKVSRV